MSPEPSGTERPRKWRRRLLRLAVWGAGALVLLRIGLGLGMPWILDRAVAGLGLTAVYDSLHLSLLGGHVEIWQLELRPRADGGGDPPQDPRHSDPVVRLEYATVDLDLTSLLTSGLVVRRAEVDGLDASLVRHSDGSVWLAGVPAPEPDAGPANPEPESAPAPGRALDFTPPLVVHAARAQAVTLRVRDRPGDRDHVVHLDVALSHLGSGEREAELAVDAWSPGTIEALRLRGRGRGGLASLAAELRVRGEGLRPRAIRSLLASLDLAPAADLVDFGLDLTARLDPDGREDPAGSLTLDLGSVYWHADGEESLALDELTLQVPALDRLAAEDIEVALRGLRAEVARSAEGHAQWGGFELLPGSAGEAPASPEAVAATPGEEPFRLHVRECRVEEAAFALEDHAIDPPSEVAVDVPRLSAKDLSTSPSDLPATLSASLRVPGSIAELSVRARVAGTGRRRDLQLGLQGTGVTLDSLRPWLLAAGLEPTLEDGDLSLEVQGGIELLDEGLAADLELKDLRLRDEEQLLRLDSVAMRRLSVGPDRVEIAEVTGVGPVLSLVHEEDGSLVFAGLRTVATGAVDAQPAAAVEASAPDAAEQQRNGLLVERVSWSGLAVHVTDQQWQPPLRTDIEDVELTVTGIALGIEEEQDPAGFEASLAIADVARRVHLTGELQQDAAQRSLDADVELRGEGLRLEPLRPYLESLGIRPLLEDGTLEVRVSASVNQAADGTHARVTARDIRLQDGDRQWLALDRLEVADARLDGRGTDVGSIVLRGTSVAAERGTDGAIRLLGVVLDAGAAGDPTPGAEETASDVAALPPPPPVRLSEISFEDLEIAWSDVTQTEPLQAVARLQVALSGLDTRSEERPASWQARLEVPGELESLQLEGSLKLTEAGPFLTTRVVAEGLHPDALAAYLPEGVESTLEAGRLRVELEASRTAGRDGVRSRVALSDLDFRDGDAEQPLLAAASAIAAMSESEEELVFQELTSSGIAVSVRDSESGLEALGLRFARGAPSGQQQQQPEEGRSTAERLRLGASSWRVIRLEEMDVGVERLIWEGGDGGPGATASVRIATPGPQVLLADDLESLEPVIVELTGKVEGVLDELSGRFRVRPFTSDPELEVSFAASGLSGSGLTAALPSLTDRLDAGELEGGSLRGDLRAVLRMPRRSPTELDFSRPFGGRVELENLELRAAEDGPVLAGVQAVTTEIARVEPATGAVRVAFLEIHEPMLVARRRTDGMHALGVLWKDRPPSEPPADAAPRPAGEAAKAEVAPESTAAAPRLRLDLVSLQGLDLDFVDESVEPAVPLPLLNGDLELRGLDSALEGSTPLRFRFSVSGGMVSLPERDYGSFVGGILAAAADVVTGGSDEAEMEERPFFDELAVSGGLQLEPPGGWVKASLRSLELLNLRGLAKEAGVEIGEGLLDAAVGLDFQDDGDLAVDSELVFQYLSLSEPAGGPIATYLQLPAPLDTVIFALRDASGTLDVPLSFTVQEGRISGSQIASAAISAFGRLVATAIAKSPLRVAGTVTDLFGLTGGQPEPVEYEPIAVGFVAGSAALGPEQRRALEPLVAVLLDDEQLSVAVQHRLGTADVERAEAFANPGEAETRELGRSLRHRKAELALQRERTLTEARSLWAAGDAVGAVAASERLTAVDRELGRLEQALDQVYGLLRPGAERRRSSRTRDAALAVARLRMQAVRDYLAQRGVPDVDERFETRRPRFATEAQREQGEVLLQPRIRLLR